MKKTIVTGAAALALVFAFTACAELSQSEINEIVEESSQQSAPANNGAVYSPSRGILCDRKAGFCADSYGISMAYTKEYLGQAAQDKLMGYGDDFETASFGMSNGVYCDSNVKKCYNNKWKERVDYYYTRKLFQ